MVALPDGLLMALLPAAALAILIVASLAMKAAAVACAPPSPDPDPPPCPRLRVIDGATEIRMELPCQREPGHAGPCRHDFDDGDLAEWSNGAARLKALVGGPRSGWEFESLFDAHCSEPPEAA